MNQTTPSFNLYSIEVFLEKMRDEKDNLKKFSYVFSSKKGYGHNKNRQKTEPPYYLLTKIFKKIVHIHNEIAAVKFEIGSDRIKTYLCLHLKVYA